MSKEIVVTLFRYVVTQILVKGKRRYLLDIQCQGRFSWSNLIKTHANIFQNPTSTILGKHIKLFLSSTEIYFKLKSPQEG